MTEAERASHVLGRSASNGNDSFGDADDSSVAPSDRRKRLSTLLRSEHAVVRVAVLVAAADLTPKERSACGIVPAYLPLLEDPDMLVSTAASCLLLQLEPGERQALSGNLARALNIASGSPRADVRRLVVQCFPRLGPVERFPHSAVLGNLLSDSDAAVRAHAALQVCGLGSSTARCALERAKECACCGLNV